MVRDDLAGGGRLLRICFAMLTNFAKAAGKYVKVSVRKMSVLQPKLQLNFRLCMCCPSSRTNGRRAHPLLIVTILWLLPDVFALWKQMMYGNYWVCVFFVQMGFTVILTLKECASTIQ